MSSYELLSFRIVGVSPLLMHNGQLVDPLNPFSEAIAEITKKRKKTKADHREMARREFFGGLYLDGGEPCIPGEMVEAMLVAGSKREKRGPAAKAGIIVEANARLEYDGPRDPDGLFSTAEFNLRVPAKVGMARVMRTRPRFPKWSAALEIKFLPSLLNAGEVKSFLVTAGREIGLGDWRPKFGRFEIL